MIENNGERFKDLTKMYSLNYYAFINWQIFTRVVIKPSASIFGVKQSKKWNFLLT